METHVTAGVDGVVESIVVKEGDNVKQENC